MGPCCDHGKLLITLGIAATEPLRNFSAGMANAMQIVLA